MSPKICTNCSKENKPTAKFCYSCGTKLPVEEAVEKPKVQISSDRMNAILNARNDLKSTFSDDVKNFTKDNKSSIKELAISQKDNRIGYYVSRDFKKTEYLIIENIEGNSVTGKISDSFQQNGYGTEYFSGTINGNSIEINGIQRQNSNCEIFWDLHFSGTISDNEISGTWNRIKDKDEYMVYKKL